MQILYFQLLSPLLLFFTALNVLGGDRKLCALSLEGLKYLPLALPCGSNLDNKVTDFVFLVIDLLLMLLCNVYLAVCMQMVYSQMKMMFFPRLACFLHQKHINLQYLFYTV